MVTKVVRGMQVHGIYVGEPVKVFDVELQIDEQRILKQLASKARRNKSLRSATMGGAVRIKLRLPAS